jgi:hypothetical protein
LKGFKFLGIEYCIVKEPTFAVKSYNDLDITMYPNSATHMLSIQFGATAELTVTLFDLLGRKVLSKVLDKNNSDIDFSSIAPEHILFKRRIKGRRKS